jgi:hypothetical protein
VVVDVVSQADEAIQILKVVPRHATNRIEALSGMKSSHRPRVVIHASEVLRHVDGGEDRP